MDANGNPTVRVARTISDVAEVAESVMRLGALVGGDDQGADMTSTEDPLDRYRRDVERHLGDRLALLEEETYERFFDHVIASFDRDVRAADCARAW